MEVDEMIEKICNNEILLPQMCVNMAIEELKEYILEKNESDEKLNKALLFLEKANGMLYEKNYDFIKEVDDLLEKLGKK